jgi:hypothetical protein
MIAIIYEACADLAMNNNVVIIYLCAGHTKTKWYLSSRAFISYDKQILFSLATSITIKWRERQNLTIKEEKGLNFVILLKRNRKNYVRQVLFHLKVLRYLWAGHTKTKWYLSSRAFILYDKQILFSLATFWY